MQDGTVEVDVRPFETEDLSSPHARHRSKEKCRPYIVLLSVLASFSAECVGRAIANNLTFEAISIEIPEACRYGDH